jgi:hypothetical protein
VRVLVLEERMHLNEALTTNLVPRDEFMLVQPLKERVAPFLIDGTAVREELRTDA